MAIEKFNFESLNRFSALILGESGAGKTTLISTIPENQSALIFSVKKESGLMSVKDMLEAARDGKRQAPVEVRTIETWADMNGAMKMLEDKRCRDKYDWVFFDSLTAIGDSCLEYMQSMYKHGLEAFGRFSEAMERFIIRARDMTDYIMVFTCLAKLIDGMDKEEKRYAPVLPGQKLSDKVVSLFDEVMFITSKVNGKNPSRVIITDSYEGYPGKTRSRKLEYFEEPDLTVIAGKILGWKAEAPAEAEEPKEKK
ncbi:MAG: ATP-binding protein [Deltaproteobacteria bacterium]|jgi:hypothetical protein|nr:ATP-binding protein [Deltaproteobacteria bacterium]